jgi:hypothetical protein
MGVVAELCIQVGQAADSFLGAKLEHLLADQSMPEEQAT